MNVEAPARRLAATATQALRAVASPEDAPAMARYMKTEMPFLGVKSPARKVVRRDLTARFPVSDHATYHHTTSSLWALPHREEKYLAIAWARRWKTFVVPASMHLYQRFVVEGAWWDFVDEVAAHLVGTVLLDHRDALRQYARTDPATVRTFVLDHRDAWSDLTFRETTKHIEV